MLTTITFANFKSYVDGRLPLAPLTVLVGANASGKSNAIEAMRLLAWLAQGQKLSAIQYAVNGAKVVRGSVDMLPYCDSESFSVGCESDTDTWNELRLTLAKRNDGLHIVNEFVTQRGASVPLYVLDQPSTGHGTDVGVAYNNFAAGANKPHVTCSDQMAIFTQLTSPATFGVKHQKSKTAIPLVTKAFEQWLSAILFLDPVPAAMRDYSFPYERSLRGDGQNLSAVLLSLCGAAGTPIDATREANRAEILQFIRTLPEQDVAGLDFLHEPRGGVMVQLTETFGGRDRKYDASLLSDGTLRVLAIAAAMLSVMEGGLVVIEEIDNGAHPSRARHLLERIRSIAERRQLRVLLSTHNPALLDALPDRAVPDVVFCYRDPASGASRLVRLENVPDYPELIAQGTLGHLSTSGLLERFVKSHTGDDRQRKQLALAWLERVRGETAP